MIILSRTFTKNAADEEELGTLGIDLAVEIARVREAVETARARSADEVDRDRVRIRGLIWRTADELAARA
jgi:hypothetical protein